MITPFHYTLKGVSMMMMKNGQTADPLNQFTRLLNRLNAKPSKDKTEEDHQQIANVEWWAGLYTTKPLTITDDGEVVAPEGTSLMLPSHLIESVIRQGARKSKQGKQMSAGMMLEEDATFVWHGPKNLADMAPPAVTEYTHRCQVVVSRSRVVRTRPLFRQWSVRFTVNIDTLVIDEVDMRTALEIAGQLIGLGDWRPGAPHGGSFGRFTLEAA